MKAAFYQKSTTDTLLELESNLESGLNDQQIQQRLEINGPNRLQGQKPKSVLMRVLAQFKDFLVIILIIAAIISVIAGEGLKDALIIVAILIVNMIIGITQENKADNALKQLKELSTPKAKVRRNGITTQIDSDSVVIGDIVILDAGDYIPADIRIIESMNLKVDESALTGESVPVDKDANIILEAGASLGDRINMASMGTIVTYGRGVGVVCATGMNTEMGKIATILNESDDTVTPLQIKLNQMAKTLGIVCIITCIIVFSVAYLYNILNIGEYREMIEMLMVSVSLAVAAVPEGVAIVATVILAIGVGKMVKSNVIVKKLRAVETLGSTTVICSDKTGTMTQNKMTVVKVFDFENEYDVSGSGYSAVGEVITSNISLTKNIALMSEIAGLCNDSTYDQANAKVIGDPTEAAMLVFGAKLGLDKELLNVSYPRIDEIPFDSERKMMSTYNLKDNKVVMNVKGAPDEVIKRCNFVYQNGKIVTLDDSLKASLIRQNELFASQAFRVLGFAYKEYANQNLLDNLETDLVYVGMMCMIDPPREEVKAAIEKCHVAGINVKMITGDHKITAYAIAKELGIINEGAIVLTGNDINHLSDLELQEQVKTINVFARVSPEHKVRIVVAIKANNNIVAMTGDGVNDAPSLKKADIGIAMGITGTDVSKEAADMILTDDNFVSIVAAVEQGRTIYGNIRKVTEYLLSCNIGEILIILLAIIFALPIPLVATQLLFVNLLTDAFPAFALGMEEQEEGVMHKPPRDPQEPLINKNMQRLVGAKSIFLCIGTLGSFLFGLLLHNYAVAISMSFFTLVTSELLLAYSSRTEAFIGLKRLLFSNKALNISIILSLLVLLAVIYIPLLSDLFSVIALDIVQVSVCLIFILIIIIGSEFSKKFIYKNH